MARPESSASLIAFTHLYLSQKYSNLKTRVFARFEFRAVAKAPSAPPSTYPCAPRSSYELAAGSTLKVSRSINGPDQALISPMRHQGQPLRLEPLLRIFYLIQAVSWRLLSFWTVFGRPGALACKGGVLLVREGLGFLKFRCTCHLLLFLNHRVQQECLPTTRSDQVIL